MTFPETELPIQVQLLLSDVWTDVTDYVYGRDPILIFRGRSDEAAAVEPTRGNLTFDNRDGRFSHRNPLGAYFGSLTRNTRCRINLTAPTGRLYSPATTASTHSSTPDSSHTSVTGDIDVRVDLEMFTWREATFIVSKYGAAPNLGYKLSLNNDGTLLWGWSNDGTTELTATSTARVPLPDRGRKALRVTMDVNNGAGGRTITFYYADNNRIDDATVWEQLGSAVVQSGTTSIFNGTSSLFAFTNLPSNYYRLQIRNGIGGTVVADPIWEQQGELGSGTFVDQAIGALTGEQAVADSGAITRDYLVCDDADAADITVGDYVILTTSADVNKESTIFTVTSKNSAFGFTNIFFTPNAGALTVTGDKMKVIGNTWAISGDAEQTLRDTRIDGELANLPPRYDITGRDAHMPAEIAGITRRLSQGDTKTASTFYRALTTLATPAVAYWPLEDAVGATSFASAVPNGRPMGYGGAITLASNSEYDASDALPVLGATGSLTGSVTNYTGTGNIQVRCLYTHVPTELSVAQTLMRVYTTGTVAHWDVNVGSGPTATMGFVSYDSNGTLLTSFGPFGFNITPGQQMWLSFELAQNGSNIDVTLQQLDPGAETGGTANGTQTSRTVSRATKVQICPDGYSLDGAVIGHISVQSEVTSLFALADELRAWAGETAGRRIYRLCGEENVPFRIYGDIDATVEMGPQRVAPLMTLLQDCATADSGILFEPRDEFGLAYLPRTSLHTQPNQLELDLSFGQIQSPLAPTPDDQATFNDITASRVNGSEYRAVKETGPLSVNEPPNGIGRYPRGIQVNVNEDTQLPDIAGWIRNLNTVDEERYPQITLNLAHPEFVDNVPLTADIWALDIGHRIALTNPSTMPPDEIAQIIQGLTEQLSTDEFVILPNCTPASPYQVATFGDGESRYSSVGSTLTSGITSTAASFQVTTVAGGRLWVTSGTKFPLEIVIGGETMTVTSITGAASPQTFYVERSTNGVVKSHSAGATVQIANQVRYAI